MSMAWTHSRICQNGLSKLDSTAQDVASMSGYKLSMSPITNGDSENGSISSCAMMLRMRSF